MIVDVCRTALQGYLRHDKLLGVLLEGMSPEIKYHRVASHPRGTPEWTGNLSYLSGEGQHAAQLDSRVSCPWHPGMSPRFCGPELLTAFPMDPELS